MGWPRKLFLNAAAAAGGVLLASGVTAYAAPEFYSDLSTQFEEAGGGAQGGRYTGMAAAFTAIEPNTALMIGGTMLAYGLLVPKDA